jgi:hypothetical protein
LGDLSTAGAMAAELGFAAAEAPPSSFSSIFRRLGSRRDLAHFLLACFLFVLP